MIAPIFTVLVAPLEGMSQVVPQEAGNAFDAVPFGYAIGGGDGTWFGVRWAEPRKVRQVVVDWGDGGRVPDPGHVKLQYWHGTWDGKADPVQAEAGAGRVGWAAMDDWTNGKWVDAATEMRREGNVWSFTFAPTGPSEIEGLTGEGVGYRKTIKVRLIGDGVTAETARGAL